MDTETIAAIVIGSVIALVCVTATFAHCFEVYVKAKYGVKDESKSE